MNFVPSVRVVEPANPANRDSLSASHLPDLVDAGDRKRWDDLRDNKRTAIGNPDVPVAVSLQPQNRHLPGSANMGVLGLREVLRGDWPVVTREGEYESQKESQLICSAFCARRSATPTF